MIRLSYTEWLAQHQIAEDKEQCAECEGEGLCPCFECRGTGEVECPHCGNVADCEECDGRGEVICLTCLGTGSATRRQYADQRAREDRLLPASCPFV